MPAPFLVAGIVNLTPDSFSNQGPCPTVDAALARVREVVGQGADIVDLGAESTRPGAEDIGQREEWRRLRPVLEQAARLKESSAAGGAPFALSVDSFRARTAANALECAGAAVDIINDISGCLFEPELAEVLASFKPGYVLGHCPVRPAHMAGAPGRPRVVDELLRWFSSRMDFLVRSGLPEECICLDPCIGFAKNSADSLSLIAAVPRLLGLGRPLYFGISRKSLLGEICGRKVDCRDAATVAATALLGAAGVAVHRVHDVAGAVDALKLARAFALAGERPAGEDAALAEHSHANEGCLRRRKTRVFVKSRAGGSCSWQPEPQPEQAAQAGANPDRKNPKSNHRPYSGPDSGPGSGRRSLLLLGGSFNPPHIGHFRIAVEAAEALGAGSALLIPCATPPHKPGGNLLPFKLRAELLRAGIADMRWTGLDFGVSELEAERQGPSYTIDTLALVSALHPDFRPAFIMGGEDYANLRTWKRWNELPDFADLLILPRGGASAGPEAFTDRTRGMWPQAVPEELPDDPPDLRKLIYRLPGSGRLIYLPQPFLEISSTLVRHRLLEGKSLSFLLPRGVEALLRADMALLRRLWA